MGRTVAELMSGNISNAIRNVETWGGIIFNVKAYGAVGDGETDDTAAFQRAANAVEENGGGVFEIPFSENGYVIAGSVDMPGNVRVRGNQSLILASSSDNADTPFCWDTKDNIIVEGLRIDGKKELKDSGTSVTGGSNCMTFKNACSNIRIRDCYLYNSLEHGIHLLGQKTDTGTEKPVNVVIEGCTFENTGNPDYPAGPRGSSIMCIHGVSNVKVYNCTFKDFTFAGCYIDSAHSASIVDVVGYNNSVIGCTFKITEDIVWPAGQQGYAVTTQGQQRCLVKGNTFELTGNYAAVRVSASQEKSPTKHIEIVDNIIYAGDFNAILFSDAFDSLIARNIIYSESTTNDAIKVEANYADIVVKRLSIKNNQLFLAARRGIYVANEIGIAANLQDIVISDNEIFIDDTVEITSVGIAVGDVVGLTIERNRIAGGYYGITPDTDTTYGVIKDNVISGCNIGMLINCDALVQGNTVRDCVTYDIRITNSGARAVLNVCTLSASTDIANYFHVVTKAIQFGRTAGTSYLNPIAFGPYYVWVDSGGLLRIKNGLPSSTTDGTVVGTQS